VVCATHDDIAQVTAAIRAERQHAGELGEDVRMDRFVPLHYTLAQKTDARQFHEGQVLVFHGSELPPKSPDNVRRLPAMSDPVFRRSKPDVGLNPTIRRISHRFRTSRDERAYQRECRSRVVTASEAQAFDVYERRPMQIAPHDQLLLTANRQETGFSAMNGERVTVSQVEWTRTVGCTSRVVAWCRRPTSGSTTATR
jgi:hypothetical protein